MMRLFTSFGVAVLGTALGLTAASAADMAPLLPSGPAYEAPEPPLAFGTGWYLRGDASFGSEDHPRLEASGGTATFDKNATEWGYGVGGGAGYKFNAFLRADVTADYLDPFTYRDTVGCGVSCATTYKTNLWRWDGLVNGYVDLGSWWGFTPYVGAGAGVSGTHQDGSVAFNGGPVSSFIDPRTGAATDGKLASHTDYRFAWAAMAGFAYALDSHMMLDVGYRYLDLGRSTIPLYPLATVRKDITTQQVRVGIRYMID